MWSSKYSNIDTNGFADTVSVTVLYYNDTDARTVAETIQVLPQNLDSDDFKALIQRQVDKLDAKDAALSKSFDTILQATDITAPVAQFIPLKGPNSPLLP